MRRLMLLGLLSLLAGCGGTTEGQACTTVADCGTDLPDDCKGSDGGALACRWICSEGLCELGT